MNDTVPPSSRTGFVTGRHLRVTKLVTTRSLLLIACAILLIKAIFLVLDRTPSYFFGDSESYLATAVIKWIPGGRSFLYGLLIRRVAFHLHSLEALIYLQALCSAVAAWLLYVALLRLFSTRIAIAAAASLFCAIEPLQLMMERYVMTESVSNFLFAIYFVLILAYLKNGRLWTILLSQAVGVLLIGIRISFLPEVLFNSVLVPLLSPYALSCYRGARLGLRDRASLPDGRIIRKVAAHLVLCLLVSQGLMSVYKHRYGSLMHREPALLYENGAFLMADFAPLIGPQDFPNQARGRAVLARVHIDQKDLQYRPAHHFMNGGLWSAVQAEFPDPREANQVAVSTAIHALLREPSQGLVLARETLLLYFDRQKMKQWLLLDEGAVGGLSANTRSWLQSRFGVAAPQSYQPTLTKRWHQFALPWYWMILCVLAASPLILFANRGGELGMLIVLVTTALIFLEGATLTVDRPTPRFLTTDAWLVLLLLGVGAEALVQHVTQRQEHLQESLHQTSKIPS